MHHRLGPTGLPGRARRDSATGKIVITAKKVDPAAEGLDRLGPQRIVAPGTLFREGRRVIDNGAILSVRDRKAHPKNVQRSAFFSKGLMPPPPEVAPYRNYSQDENVRERRRLHLFDEAGGITTARENRASFGPKKHIGNSHYFGAGVLPPPAEGEQYRNPSQLSNLRERSRHHTFVDAGIIQTARSDRSDDASFGGSGSGSGGGGGGVRLGGGGGGSSSSSSSSSSRRAGGGGGGGGGSGRHTRRAAAAVLSEPGHVPGLGGGAQRLSAPQSGGVRHSSAAASAGRRHGGGALGAAEPPGDGEVGGGGGGGGGGGPYRRRRRRGGHRGQQERDDDDDEGGEEEDDDEEEEGWTERGSARDSSRSSSSSSRRRSSSRAGGDSSRSSARSSTGRSSSSRSSSMSSAGRSVMSVRTMRELDGLADKRKKVEQRITEIEKMMNSLD